MSALRQSKGIQVHHISLITFSQPIKKYLLSSYYIQGTAGDAEGRGTKRKDLIQAQELVIKTGNVNNAKYTKQNQEKRKVNLQIITPSVEETNHFVC